MKIPLCILLLSVSETVLAGDGIVGGHPVDIKEFPYEVALFEGDSIICGGTIINNDHVLTAAHCMEDSGKPYQIRAGSSDRTSGGQLIDVAEVTVHPDFNAETFENDIAILQLKESLEFGPEVSAVHLPSSEEGTPEAGTPCTVVGWGATSQGASEFPSDLQAVTVEIVDHEQCVKEYQNGRDVTDSMICAGVEGGGKDSCQGDSGGPLIDESSKEQVGIVSWGFGCGKSGQSGVYLSTAAYEDWIQQNS